MKSRKIDRFRIEMLIRELKSKRGRGTELISLYIPAGRPIGEVMSVLRDEYSTATNIKDRTTRHHVLEALTSIMQRLKLFRATPPNGLIIFAGYVAGSAPGDEKMEIHVLEPPQTLRTWLYRCDSRFHTDILEDMIAVKETYGLIALDRGEAAFGVLRGKFLDVVEEITSGIPGKHRAGGQSARRFERIHNQLVHEFYKRIGEHANRIFLPIEDLKGIIVGGPGPAKDEFVDGDYLHYKLKEKILGVFDIGYSGEAGIYELANRAADLLEDVEYIRERQLVNKFLYHIARDTGLAIYGEEEVRKYLLMGAVDILLLSEKLEAYRVTLKCENCGYKEEKTFKEIPKNPTCPKCGASLIIEQTKLLIEDLIELAESTGTRVELISTETSEGKELFRSFGGIAAILRFKV
ncbi:MAG: peptide chain release factor aRF-1 [Thermoproteales archaeon]|nr:peptide chain release factor aRF-1 [Thermoproteales archaeon]